MPIFFPDILENNNPNFPLVDATFLKGNSYPLTSINDTGSIPSNKRNVGVVVFDTTAQEFYAFKGTTVAGWDTPSNWVRFGSADIALVTASISDATITFEKGDGSTFDLTVDTGSSTTVDNYWELINNNIVNSGSLDVIITSSLTVDQFTNNDIFIIKRQGIPKVKVNSQGVFTLIPTSSFPTAVTGV